MCICSSENATLMSHVLLYCLCPQTLTATWESTWMQVNYLCKESKTLGWLLYHRSCATGNITDLKIETPTPFTSCFANWNQIWKSLKPTLSWFNTFQNRPEIGSRQVHASNLFLWFTHFSHSSMNRHLNIQLRAVKCSLMNVYPGHLLQ